jgi:hypothetical protein
VWTATCRPPAERGVLDRLVEAVTALLECLAGLAAVTDQCAVQSVYGCDATALGATVGTSDAALPVSYTARSMSQSLL